LFIFTWLAQQYFEYRYRYLLYIIMIIPVIFTSNFSIYHWGFFLKILYLVTWSLNSNKNFIPASGLHLRCFRKNYCRQCSAMSVESQRFALLSMFTAHRYYWEKKCCKKYMQFSYKFT
jgi:hypothetical protein